MTWLKTETVYLLMLTLFVTPVLQNPAIAGPGSSRWIPDVGFSHAETAATEPVALYTLPDGQGNSFLQAQTFGGSPNTDATITLSVRTPADTPLPDWPVEDMWLESQSGGLVLACSQGTTADFNTDENGLTIFQAPLCASGHNDPPSDLLVIVLSGMPLEEPGLEIFVNSPDLSGDGLVSLIDVSLFANAYIDPSHHPFCADFWWNGVVTLTDLVLFVQGYGATCP